MWVATNIAFTQDTRIKRARITWEICMHVVAMGVFNEAL